MQNKIAIITGSADHIGKATVLKFANAGYKVVVTSKSSKEKGEAVVNEIISSGGEAFYFQGDLSDPSVCEKLVETTIEKYNRIDVLVNNAGTALGEPFLDSTKENWIKNMEANLFSTVFCSQAVAKVMLKQNGGKIINTASIRGMEATGRERIMAYSAAKAGVINFTKTLAKELAPHILVNAVAPGFVQTKNYENNSAELNQSFIDNTLIKRFITPEEIADTHLFIASSNAMTGEVIVVDGGFTLKLG